MNWRFYDDKIAELQEEIRQLRVIAFGTDIVIPAEWKLSRTQTALLQCLAAREVVTWDTWASACTALNPNFDAGPAVMKVHVSHLRRKLRPVGIVVYLRHGVGYSLEPRVRARLRATAEPLERAA